MVDEEREIGGGGFGRKEGYCNNRIGDRRRENGRRY